MKGISLTDVVTGKVQNNNNDYKIMFFDQRDRSGISITGLHHTKKNMHKAIIDGSETYGYLISTGGTKGVSSKKETNLIGVQAKWWESRSSTHSIESMFHPIAPNSAYDLLVRKSKIQVSMLQ